MLSQYEIGFCQRFNEEIHGFNSTNSPEIRNHYLCLFTFDIMNEEQFLSVQSLSPYCRATIEIVETFMLYPGNEMVAIYKTFWFRIFQRICRKWILNRRYARSSRLMYHLLYRECSLNNYKNG